MGGMNEELFKKIDSASPVPVLAVHDETEPPAPVEEKVLAKDEPKDLVPPPPSGAPIPETYIRTLPSDAETVRVGGTPDLVPHHSKQKSAAPAAPPLAAVPAAVFGKSPLERPSPRRQSWGTALAIVIIVVMVIVGAFYAWGKRVAEQNSYPAVQG